MEEQPGAWSPVATWPSKTHDVTGLRNAAERALRDGRGVVVRAPSGEADLALPVLARNQKWCVVAIKMSNAADADFVRTMRSLHWGSGWLEALAYREDSEVGAQEVEQQSEIVELMRLAAASGRATSAALSITNLLATRLSCRRVAIGVATRGQVKVLGLSHAAILDRRSKTAIAIASAMEEALDQASSVSYPPASPMHERRIAMSHRELARRDSFGAVLSVVMIRESRPIGVITFAREAPETFDPIFIQFCEHLADALAPIMNLQISLDLPVSGRIPSALTTYVRKLTNRQSYATKLVTVLLAGIAPFRLLVQSDYRVSAKATLEGIVQQAAVAPFDGFVATAPHRAGDLVQAGDTIATLDTRDLTLEALRFESLRDQAQLRQQEATARGDRATAAVESATAREAEAQRSLAADKIERATITAPFTGLIVSGDLSQSLGSPVERGKVLFEIAPLDSYRINLAIDERDIAYVAEGQTGQLVLTGYAAEAIGFQVAKVVPVATPGEGANTFRVEATLDLADPRLRPGMEGVGKVDVGRAPIAWIWTHGLIDWAQLVLWKWLP
jgi:multidrug resistance efflux pump